MKNKSIRVGSILLSLCEIIVGILLLINPMGFTVGIITFLGVVLLIAGAVSVIQYFRIAPEEAAQGRSLASGLIEIALGLFCVLRSGWFLATFPVFTMVYGTVTLVTGIAKIQWAVDMIRAKKTKWWWGAIDAAVTIVCAVIILCNPFTSTTVIWTFVAISLIVEAVADVIVALFTKEA